MCPNPARLALTTLPYGCGSRVYALAHDVALKSCGSTRGEVCQRECHRSRQTPPGLFAFRLSHSSGIVPPSYMRRAVRKPVAL
jgi:hypothetical protein